MSGGDTSELRKDIVRGSRPDYISPLDDLAFDIYQVIFINNSLGVTFYCPNYNDPGCCCLVISREVSKKL